MHIFVKSNMVGGSHLGFVDYRDLRSKFKKNHHHIQHGRKNPVRHITRPFKSVYMSLTHLPQFLSKLGVWAPLWGQMKMTAVGVFMHLVTFVSINLVVTGTSGRGGGGAGHRKRLLPSRCNNCIVVRTNWSTIEVSVLLIMTIVPSKTFREQLVNGW